jgi:hypothetical protein
MHAVSFIKMSLFADRLVDLHKQPLQPGIGQFQQQAAQNRGAARGLETTGGRKNGSSGSRAKFIGGKLCK